MTFTVNKEYQFTVTKVWLNMYTTEKGSWTAKQLACLGIGWPPRKGWINRAVGTVILVSVKEQFEQLAKEPVKEKVTIQQLERRIMIIESEMERMKLNLNNRPLIN